MKSLDKTIEKRIKEGRGFREGSNYLPWITARVVLSLGRCSEILGWKTNRVHLLLSDLETRYFYTLEFPSDVIDIREQYLLFGSNKSINETVKIAESIGVKYPIITKTGALNVQTTLITIIINGKTEQIARTVKYAKNLSKEKTIEKFKIERLYWVNRGIYWKIVTELLLRTLIVQYLHQIMIYMILNLCLFGTQFTDKKSTRVI